MKGTECHSRTYEEGTCKRDGKDLDVVLGEERLLLVLTLISIRPIPISAIPSAPIALCSFALYEQRHMSSYMQSLRMLKVLLFMPAQNVACCS